MLKLSICNVLKYWLILIGLMFTPITFAASEVAAGLWLRMKTSLTQTWKSNEHELYIPVNTWHNRANYSAKKINSYNEQPWGLGVGKYRYDEEDNWHSLYIIVFKDSNNDLEPVVGYAYQKMWLPAHEIRYGLGYTVGVTVRGNDDYLPMPVVAPLVSIAYKKLALQSTYIIGGNGYGNVLFTWLRWQLD